MKKIKIIWRLLDGKKGHEKQSLALVRSLKEQSRCRIFDINIQDGAINYPENGEVNKKD